MRVNSICRFNIETVVCPRFPQFAAYVWPNVKAKAERTPDDAEN